MAGIPSRERGPDRTAVIRPRDLFEEQDWNALAKSLLLAISRGDSAIQTQITALQQQTNQPQWTVVQESADYEFPAAFIRAEINATSANRTATLPLSDTLQGQLVNVAKSDSGVNTVTFAAQGTDSLFIATGDDVLSGEWDSVVLIAVPGGWSIQSRSV